MFFSCEVLSNLGRNSRGGSAATRRDGSLRGEEERHSAALARAAAAPQLRTPKNSEEVKEEQEREEAEAERQRGANVASERGRREAEERVLQLQVRSLPAVRAGRSRG